MKPDWKDAPSWANWMAMDEDGQWFWFENKPVRDDGCWWQIGKYESACVYSYAWKESVEARPS